MRNEREIGFKGKYLLILSFEVKEITLGLIEKYTGSKGGYCLANLKPGSKPIFFNTNHSIHGNKNSMISVEQIDVERIEAIIGAYSGCRYTDILNHPKILATSPSPANPGNIIKQLMNSGLEFEKKGFGIFASDAAAVGDCNYSFNNMEELSTLSWSDFQDQSRCMSIPDFNKTHTAMEKSKKLKLDVKNELRTEEELKRRQSLEWEKKTFYAWQEKLLQRLDRPFLDPEFDCNKVIFVVDKEGHSGKSTFANYLSTKVCLAPERNVNNTFQVLGISLSKDPEEYFYGIHSEANTWIIDLTRQQSCSLNATKNLPYSFFEKLLSGNWNSSKYKTLESSLSNRYKPQVVIYMNSFPTISQDTLTLQKFEIYCIDHSTMDWHLTEIAEINKIKNLRGERIKYFKDNFSKEELAAKLYDKIQEIEMSESKYKKEIIEWKSKTVDLQTEMSNLKNENEKLLKKCARRRAQIREIEDYCPLDNGSSDNSISPDASKQVCREIKTISKERGESSPFQLMLENHPEEEDEEEKEEADSNYFELDLNKIVDGECLKKIIQNFKSAS